MADTKNVAIRKSYLLKSNILFDVDLPFSEDAYLSWELKKKGILTEYCPKMIVFHNKKMTFFIF